MKISRCKQFASFVAAALVAQFKNKEQKEKKLLSEKQKQIINLLHEKGNICFPGIVSLSFLLNN